jgi:hypothetical protein
MSGVSDDSVNDEERGEARAQAFDDIREARRELASSDSEVPDVVDRALEEAERELSSDSECRLAEPFAPIIQVGDQSGLHYECTHFPSHRY